MSGIDVNDKFAFCADDLRAQKAEKKQKQRAQLSELKKFSESG
jgi:hypothetical protein